VTRIFCVVRLVLSGFFFPLLYYTILWNFGNVLGNAFGQSISFFCNSSIIFGTVLYFILLTQFIYIYNKHTAVVCTMFSRPRRDEVERLQRTSVPQGSRNTTHVSAPLSWASRRSLDDTNDQSHWNYAPVTTGRGHEWWTAWVQRLSLRHKRYQYYHDYQYCITI
jgi:hypothetical protein